MTLEHLKRLEGEVLDQLHALGASQAQLGYEGHTVTLQQLRGIEINPRAAALAELVLWVGWLQWQIRTGGVNSVAEPVVHDYGNIECRDALLVYDAQAPAHDAAGRLLTRWDGVSFRTHPTDGYVDAVQSAWPQVPEASDFVMRWWHHAASLVRAGQVRRFGFITSNSIRQAYVRRAVEPHLQGDDRLSILFAIPDHPWVDSADGAAVRIAMTVGAAGRSAGRLVEVMAERAASNEGEDLVERLSERQGTIGADLRIGADVANARPLRSNLELCSVGMKTIGAAFQVAEETAHALGLGSVPGLEAHIRPYLNGRDFTAQPRGMWVIDFFGLERPRRGALERRRRAPSVDGDGARAAGSPQHPPRR